MKPVTIVIGAAVSFGLFVWFTADAQKPKGGRLGTFNPAAKTSNLAQVAALPPGLSYEKYLDGEFNGWLWASQQNLWNQRAAALQVPPITGTSDARYNELYYSGPWVLVLAPENVSMAEGNVKIEGKPVVSRNWYGSNPKSEGGGLDALGLIGMIGNYTLPFIPGFGTAANAALQGAVALGHGESLDNALIAAARGALPPYAQVAFDMAVGVYMGKKVDQAALDAGLNYLESKYPGSKQAYKDGLKVAKDAGL